MPYINPYPTSLPGVREALTLAIQAMIVASLADLNAALTRDNDSPLPTITSAQVVRGDPETVLRTLICVVGGGKQDAKDMDLGQGVQFMPRNDVTQPRIDVYTNIYVYIGNDDMLPANDDPLLHVEYKNTARERIADHLRKRVFNAAQGASITLASKEFHDPAGSVFDELFTARVSEIRMGVTPKLAGDVVNLYSAHLLHEGYLQ